MTRNERLYDYAENECQVQTLKECCELCTAYQVTRAITLNNAVVAQICDRCARDYELIKDAYSIANRKRKSNEKS
jgi:hypothetical protein